MYLELSEWIKWLCFDKPKTRCRYRWCLKQTIKGFLKLLRGRAVIFRVVLLSNLLSKTRKKHIWFKVIYKVYCALSVCVCVCGIGLCEICRRKRLWPGYTYIGTKIHKYKYLYYYNLESNKFKYDPRKVDLSFKVRYLAGIIMSN